MAVEVKAGDFEKAFEEVGETGLLELTLGKDVRPVLISNVQIHPVSDEILHVDFKQVDLKEKVTATVPVEFIGESPAEKQGLGTLVRMVDELEVEALPTDLPEKFEALVANLTEVGATLAVSDLKVPRVVEIKAKSDLILAKVEAPQKEEEVIAPAPEAEVPVAEGEVPAEAPSTPAPEAEVEKER